MFDRRLARRFNHGRASVRAALLLTVPALLATPLFAQAQPPATAQATSGGVADIVVTARRRAESIQDVPLAVTALDRESFERFQPRDIADISGLAPSVVIDPLGGIPGGAATSIRGIGTFEIEKTNEPSVGVTLDGIFIGSNTYALLNAFDVERLEILRGPQGVLFGRNTTAGLISITRSKPRRGEPVSVRLSGTLAERGQQDARVTLLAPIGDRVAIKLAGFTLNDDGDYRNTFLNRRAGGKNILSGQIGAKVWITDDLDIWASYEHLRDKSDLGATRNLASNPGQGLACALGQCFRGALNSPDLRNIESDRIPQTKATLDAVTVEANWRTGIGTFTYLYGRRVSDEFRITDADASRFPILWFEREQDERQSSHELRLFTDAIKGVALTVGGYVFDQEIGNTTRNRDLFPFLGSIGATGPLTFSPDFYTGSNQLQNTRSRALFASADISITDQLTLNLGGRYSWERKRFRARDALPLSQFGGFGTIFLQVAPGVRIPFTGAGYGPFQTGENDWSRFTPRIGVQYKASENMQLYASYARGFKSGGYNIRYDTTAAAPGATVPSYDPETVDTYELGLKSEFADRRVRLNAAVYYNDYRDKQEQIIAPNPATGGLTSITIIQNAASVEGYGAEVELQAVPTDGLTLGASVGYNHIKYKSFRADIDLDNNPNTTIVTDNSGLDLVRSPRWTLAANAALTRPVGPGELGLAGSFRWLSDYFLDVRNDPRGKVEAFGILDATISYELPMAGGRVSVSAFGRNLANTTRLNSFFQIATVAAIAGVNRPRTFGVELKFVY
ncbi:TonB-dependent receptor [Sandaracinobacteroides saxicola]|uniref:TonB-dependent receptor n=1 Tax=Sandaracinobacteroides saxicola TaxID=2759707 RepID=A0A7G5ILH3_9SPHN|nr:TonB-dependent receptor [Sandaracinobacteroides saxicola]QMW24215.1 TonB-dependent receptor [Sandaracinobacteroides saxicola]